MFGVLRSVSVFTQIRFVLGLETRVESRFLAEIMRALESKMIAFFAIGLPMITKGFGSMVKISSTTINIERNL